MTEKKIVVKLGDVIQSFNYDNKEWVKRLKVTTESLASVAGQIMRTRSGYRIVRNGSVILTTK